MPRQIPNCASGVKNPFSAIKPLDHVELGTKLGLFDLPRAAKISGAGFVCFTNLGARLQRGLIQFLLDLHTTEHGYVEIAPPYLVRRECMVGTGQLPKFEQDAYGLDDGQAFLIPTAEVPLANLHRDEISVLRGACRSIMSPIRPVFGGRPDRRVEILAGSSGYTSLIKWSWSRSRYQRLLMRNLRG